jgi:archaellum component FlaC
MTIEEIEQIINQRGYTIEYEDNLLSEVKRLQGENKGLRKMVAEYQSSCERRETEVKMLRKGIEKHRQLVGTHNSLVDDELYKLLVGEGK